MRRVLRFAFDHLEKALGRFFPAQWNPILNLGALGFFFYWVITATGIYLYIFFDTGVREAYSSVEYMTNEQWYAAGVMRSLHRYASDGLVIVMLLHLAREFSLDRYRGVRWFSWVTGVLVLIMIYISGITGYWLVWDRLAQYVAIVSTEWLDRLGLFAESIARNFLHPGMLNDRFFTLMIFIHIAVPLLALIALWVHLQRVIKPRRVVWLWACLYQCLHCRWLVQRSARLRQTWPRCLARLVSTGSICRSIRCSKICLAWSRGALLQP
jgi:quinol-cytochrome oxidoreductase complex cytochrome b subunit